MAKEFDIDFQYNIPEFGTIRLTAENADEAEKLAEKEINESYEDITDLQITGVREITDGQ